MLQSLTGPAVVVDCANGVGARALQKFSEVIGKKFLDATVCNDGSDGILNDKVSRHYPSHCSLLIYISQCGADYVKLHQCAPNGEIHFTNFTITAKLLIGITLEPGQRYASLDGDADRVVFFYEDSGMIVCHYHTNQLTFCYTLGKFRLLDGDKIATLVRIYLITSKMLDEVFFKDSIFYSRATSLG